VEYVTCVCLCVYVCSLYSGHGSNVWTTILNWWKKLCDLHTGQHACALTTYVSCLRGERDLCVCNLDYDMVVTCELQFCIGRRNYMWPTYGAALRPVWYSLKKYTITYNIIAYSAPVALRDTTWHIQRVSLLFTAGCLATYNWTGDWSTIGCCVKLCFGIVEYNNV